MAAPDYLPRTAATALRPKPSAALRFYVRRTRPADWRGYRPGWTGPLPASRAIRERAAWRDAGFCADIIPATREVRRWVNAWQRHANKDHGRV